MTSSGTFIESDMDDNSSKRRERLITVETLRSQYIETERDRSLRQEFDRLIDSQSIRANPALSNALREARGVCLVGASGAGKTAAVARLFRKHPALPGFGSTAHGCPIVSISAPSPCTLKQLGRSLLVALGYPLVLDQREHIVWEMVRNRLQMMKISFVHVDEMQHATQAANSLEVQKIRNTIKALLVDPKWPVAVILSGLPELIQFLNGDPQLKRRFRHVYFDMLPVPQSIPNIAQLIKDRATSAQLGVDDGVLQVFASKLIQVADRQFGIAIEMLIDAIEHAMSTGDGELTGRNFAHVFSARSGLPDSDNPFLSRLAPDRATALRSLKPSGDKE